MPDSQTWSDAVTLALMLQSKGSTADYEEVLLKYTTMNDSLEPVVQIELVTVLVTILSHLMSYVAEDLEMGMDDLATYILIEKFKRDLDV